jgi:E3 ubiquitin-protein ligase RNF14
LLDYICDKLEGLWNESKMEILYTWFSFLQNEVLTWLGYSTELDVTHIINVKPKWITKTEANFEPNKHNSSKDNNITTVSKLALTKSSKSGRNEKFVIEFKPQLNRGLGTYDQRAACDLIGVDLIPHLKAYNEFKEKETFNKSYITCNICFSLCLGEESAVFPCNHMACRKCIKEYFTTLVTEGSVNLLKCPETKCDTSAPPNLVKELISAQLFKKYDELLKASVIASMADIYYCPRKMCGIPVMAESDSSLAHCTSCGYAFCKNCKFSYHGLDPCQIFRNAKERKQILDKYREATGL